MARSIRLLLLSLVGVAAVAHVQACGSGDGLKSVVDDDAGRSIGRSDASPSGGDGSTSIATMRVAHLAPALGTVDFCYAALTGALVGPVLRGGGSDPDAGADAEAPADAADDVSDAAGDAEALDASAPGLGYGTLTKYFSLEASGTINVAIVRAGATSCANPIAAGTVTLDPGKLSTVALFGAFEENDAGDAGANPLVLAFIDNRDTEPDRARVRMIHAANAGALTVQVTGATTAVLAERLEPHKASAASQAIPVDALGFATIAPVAPPASLVVTALDGGADGDAPRQTAPADLDLRGDSLHTGFVLDGTDGGVSILWCADKSTTAELTACTLLR